MIKIIFKKLSIFLFVGLFFVIPNSIDAYSGSFTYRSTVLGSSVEQFQGGYNRIVNTKTVFSDGEQVHALTRVFNILNINTFQIKHQLFKDGNYVHDFYSTEYSPKRQWWAESYAWNNLGKLAAGNYKLRVYISVDHEAYQFYRDVVFVVSGNTNYVQGNDYIQNLPIATPIYHDYGNRYLQEQPNYNFNFVWTHTGSDVRDLGQYMYEVVNRKDTFNENERLFVVGKLVDIRGIERFKMKYDLYLNSTFYKTLSSYEQKPMGNYWKYNYTSVNFERVPAGHYTLKTSVSINGGAFTTLNTKSITVYQVYSDYRSGNYFVDYDAGRYLPELNNSNNNYYFYDNRYQPNRDFRRTRYDDRRTIYNYLKMTTGVGTIRTSSGACGSSYRIQSAKNIFSSSENVKVVTEIELTNARRVEVRHDLHLNNSGSVSKSLNVNTTCNNNNYKSITLFYSDFGRLQRGDHRIKSYIKIDNGAWKYLNYKNVKVLNSTGNYKYDWTKVGLGNVADGWYNYSPSINQKSSFFAGERISVATKLDNVNWLDNYRIKYDSVAENVW